MAEAVKQKKPGVFKRMSRFFKDVVGEMKKVVWPTKSQVLNNTGIVLVFMIIMGVILGLFDFGVNLLINWLLHFGGI